MSLQLQIALDRIELERAVEITAAVAPHTDWIEVGTSLIKRFGITAVREVAAAAGPVPVLADLKTPDDASYEFTLAYEAGAASATVLGCAGDATLDAAVHVAAEHGREVVVDLMETTGERRAALAARLPSGVVLAAHVAKDAQRAGGSPTELLGPWRRGRRVAVAGGLTAADLPAFASGPDDVRVIVGSAVTGAVDPEAAARTLAAAASRVPFPS
ncbi:orotidine 5'-phosphate decarboxylase / HUMPS family protein [Streptomyces xanthii]|uniref:Orotidine 5'-phosphate decarboxylase n=1 Tax=Streptomyces xanthii TaxID=2768069 RepID=A0A7H1BGG1_9ACTN|nr:orotidine 5'-phosphate decarboxylase / HUMPS family protein [Streptomyces xanthii]QNS07816.1 orotidine 5'-phosphate decarboxylase [Streptomyces xanthii]